MDIGSSVAFAVVDVLICVAASSYFRRFRMGPILKLGAQFILNQQNPDGSKEAVNSILQASILGSALILTIEFTFLLYLAPNSGETFSNICCFAALMNSIMHGTVCFVNGMHATFLLAVFQGSEQVQSFLKLKFYVFFDGLFIMGLQVLNFDLSVVWLVISVVVWLFFQVENVLPLAIIGIIGFFLSCSPSNIHSNMVYILLKL